MRINHKFFKNTKILPVDKFFQNVLYDKKNGYYSNSFPFGKDGDFVTAPIISRLFSETIAVWMIATWERFGCPKILNIVELGPGDGSFMKILLDISKRFPKFNKAKKVFLYETSDNLKKIQKSKIKNTQIRWINDFSKIKKGPVIFFGNEFFDAIPIKQMLRKNNLFYEKYYTILKNFKIKEIFKYAKEEDVDLIKSYKILKGLKFIELPKSGLIELKKIVRSISKLGGSLLLIDYGYLKPRNQSTLQSVKRNKKNDLLENLGNADITSQVNFSLLKEFFLKNKLQVNDIITQRDFLINMGIQKRADMIAKKMRFRDQVNLFLRLKRLIHPKLMGDLFKVIITSNFKKIDY